MTTPPTLTAIESKHIDSHISLAIYAGIELFQRVSIYKIRYGVIPLHNKAVIGYFDNLESAYNVFLAEIAKGNQSGVK